MRMRSARGMILLTGCLLGTLFILGGCQSTSLTRDAKDAGKSAANDLTWKRSANSFSTSMVAEKGNDPLNPVAFRPPAEAAKAPTAIPDLMPTGSTSYPTALMSPLHSAPMRYGIPPHGGLPMALPDAPNEGRRIVLPTYEIRPPDVLLIELLPQFKRKDTDLKIEIDRIGLNQPIMGPHVVGPDGTINLGVYGNVLVSTKTVQQAREEVARAVHNRLDEKTVKLQQVLDNLKMSIAAYNSSVYYVITDGAGLGYQVVRLPLTGNETVLDALSYINGLPVVSSSKRIWVARRNSTPGAPDTKLPVDWKGMTQDGTMNTNWQIMPGDRVYVAADPMRKFNNVLGKMLEPIERMFGATLLGGQTVNTIRNGTSPSIIR